MKNLIPFFALIIFTACHSQFPTTEQLHSSNLELNSAHSNTIETSNSSSEIHDGWYSNLSEIKGFENYEEENGIILNANLSLATYFNQNTPTDKIIILEKIKHRPNGEAMFKKLTDITIQLRANQFLTTDFCTLDNNSNAKIIALYETTNNSNKIIKAWKINEKSLELNPIATKHVKCMLDI